MSGGGLETGIPDSRALLNFGSYLYDERGRGKATHRKDYFLGFAKRPSGDDFRPSHGRESWAMQRACSPQACVLREA
jgi:hypothetical protein